MKVHRAAALLGLLALTAGACSSPPAPRAGAAPGPVSPFQASSPQPPLAEAIRTAAHLGPAGHETEVYLNLGLVTRNRDRLAQLLAAGRTISPAEYNSEFGPDPALVQVALGYLRGAGLEATWQPGSAMIAADAQAPAVAALFRVDIERYRLANGTIFYASVDTPTLAGPLAAVVDGVTGLESYRQTRNQAVKPGGLKPIDVLAFYNLNPLRSRGLDGSGETILFPEIETIPQANINDLEKFAKEFGLPPFGPLLTIKHDASWGKPEAAEGEAVLDLEIAHEVAPNARLVVYQAGPQFAFIDRAFDQMVTDHLGSVISNSIGICEAHTSAAGRAEYSTIADRSVAQGMSHFVASGDNGAYDCGEDQPASADFPSVLPQVTSVGGTSVFESTEGTYFKEAAWGGPISESGSGGGPSQFYPLPAWQKSVEDAGGHGFRQVPDVAADADPITGFHIVFNGEDTQIGGTSAAAPLWASTVALVDQDLKKKGLRGVGLANPAIYWMGDNRSKLSPSPFHDVSEGNNLAYNAGTGWDFATGWGSMDGVGLDAAWVAYIKGGGA